MKIIKGKSLKHLLNFKLSLDRIELSENHDKNNCQPYIKQYASEMVFRNCHACKSEKYNFFVKAYGFDYVECNHCGLIFMNPSPSSNLLEEYYKNLQSKNTASITFDEKSFNQRCELIYNPKIKYIQNFIQNPKCLDIGTGNGEFVYSAKKNGWDINGLEPNPEGIKYAKENLDIKLVEMNIETYLKKEKGKIPYNLITLWGSFEHLSDPNNLIRIISEKMANESYLVIEVPKADSLSTLLNRMNPKLSIRHLCPPAHITLWTLKAFQILLKQHNWDIKGVWYYGMDALELVSYLNQDYDGYIINKLVTIADDIQSLIDQNHFSDLMTIIAQKG